MAWEKREEGVYRLTDHRGTRWTAWREKRGLWYLYRDGALIAGLPTLRECKAHVEKLVA